MTWFFAILLVLLMGVVAVVAAGRGGALADVYDDRPDSLVPADRPLEGRDLRRVRFSTALRGYRMSEVDTLLERVASELEARGTDARAAGEPPGGAPRPESPSVDREEG
jgi:DivIVA domain-containing protein